MDGRFEGTVLVPCVTMSKAPKANTDTRTHTYTRTHIHTHGKLQKVRSME